MDNVFQNYDRQNFGNKELIIILNRDEMEISKWLKRAARSQNVSVYKRPDLTLGECLNFGIEKSQYDIIAKFDDDDYYAPNYLSQQIKTLQRKGADVVCKRTVFMYFEEDKTLAIHLAHRRVRKFMRSRGGVKGATLVFRKKLWDSVKFHSINVGEDLSFLKKCLKRQFKIYATDRYNYACLRRAEYQHTWKSRNDKLMSESKILCQTKEYKPFIEKAKG